MHHNEIARQKEEAAKVWIEQVYLDAARMIPDADWYCVPRMIKILCPDPRWAELLLELPAKAAEVAEKKGLPEEYVVDALEELKKRGLIIKQTKGSYATDTYRMHITIGGFVDFASTMPYSDKCTKGTNFYELFSHLLTDDEHVEAYYNFFASANLDLNNAPINRVLPKWRAVKDIPGLMPAENMKEIASHGRICTSRCCCKQIKPQRIPYFYSGVYPDEGHCLHWNNVADYYVEELGMCKMLTPDEVFELIDGLADKPICHIVNNDRDVSYLCNCEDESCMIYGTLRKAQDRGFGKIRDGLYPSRFLAVMDDEKCTGCGYCVPKCPFHAIKMSAEGKAIIDAKECYGCGTCAVVCPENACSMKLTRPPEHIPEHGFHWVETMYMQTPEPVTV